MMCDVVCGISYMGYKSRRTGTSAPSIDGVCNRSWRLLVMHIEQRNV